MRLNLGCGNDFRMDCENVDIVEPAQALPAGVEFRQVDLAGPWPWPDSSVDHALAHDIIEHLPSPIHTMNELWRVLGSGARVDIIVPTTDGRGWAQDPTHIAWPPFNRNSFRYYTHGDPHLTRFAPANGVLCAFRVISEHEELLADEVSKLHIVLEAVK